MMPSKGKGIAALIVAKAAKPEKTDEVELSGNEGPESAAEDLIVALRDKDPKAVVEAFKALRDCCAESEDGGEDEDT
jgi:hypothetical protein